jgi:hypothetical protein
LRCARVNEEGCFGSAGKAGIIHAIGISPSRREGRADQYHHVESLLVLGFEVVSAYKRGERPEEAMLEQLRAISGLVRSSS